VLQKLIPATFFRDDRGMLHNAFFDPAQSKFAYGTGEINSAKHCKY